LLRRPTFFLLVENVPSRFFLSVQKFLDTLSIIVDYAISTVAYLPGGFDGQEANN
jgi:hypothetical protein